MPANGAASAENGANVDLSGVSCPATGVCVAVGSYTDRNTNFYGLIESLVDGRWTALEAPVPADSSAAEETGLTGVACPAVETCMATGDYTGPGGRVEGLIETLSGGTWTPAAAPVLPGAANNKYEDLSSLACPAVGTCVVAGDDNSNPTGTGLHPLLLMLANGTWTASTAPVPGGSLAAAYNFASLSGVACPFAGVCVATGTYNNTPQGGLAL